MSSFIRRMGKRIARRNMSRDELAELKNKPQQMRSNPDGGYDVLHPTRGWRTVSGKRVAVQPLLAKLKGLAA